MFISRRQERMSEIIRRELSFFVAKNFDLHGAIVTLTRVEVSDDLHYARVYFLVIPDEKAESIKKMFDKSVSFIQKALNIRLRMRPVPRIKFFADTEEQEAAQVERVLDEISK